MTRRKDDFVSCRQLKGKSLTKLLKTVFKLVELVRFFPLMSCILFSILVGWKNKQSTEASHIPEQTFE